ncbi:PKD domain-containing protein [Zobellia nedashkovskayae]
MNNKSIKTHFDINVFITFLVLLLAGLALFSFRLNSEVDCSNVDFEIISNSYTTEDLIEFKSTDTSGFNWTWNFGDNESEAYRSDVVHQFKKPGRYSVSLKMNGECVASREIVISKDKIVRDAKLIPNIVVPKKVRVGDEVEFFNDSKFATSWQWSFGETAAVDGNDRREKYTYRSPGEKTILLVVNGDRRHEAKRILTVYPSKKKERIGRSRNASAPIENVLATIPEAPTEEKPVVKDVNSVDEPPYIEISNEDIKDMLLRYSVRNLDDVSIRNYFCVTNIPVFNKSGNVLQLANFLKLYGMLR